MDPLNAHLNSGLIGFDRLHMVKPQEEGLYNTQLRKLFQELGRPLLGA